MEKFDLTCTATLRPELLKRTFDSFVKNLFGDHIKQARLVLNIDHVGNDDPRTIEDLILRYLDTIPFDNIVVRTAKDPSFSRAFCWCMGQIQNPFVFNLEEDWEMMAPMDFEKMTELFLCNPTLVHLRLSSFPSDGSPTMKVWNKRVVWNDSFFEVERSQRGTIGWAGHPSLNKSAFMLAFRSKMNCEKNPEKQIKGPHPAILNSRFGVFQPHNAPAVIKDIGREWMAENGFKKQGNKAFFTNWEKDPTKELKNG